jgi:hypothetical protein
VLLITVAAGLMWWKEITHWRLVTAVGLAVLFLAGSACCIVSSAGRNGESTTGKRNAAHETNVERDRIKRLLERLN